MKQSIGLVYADVELISGEDLVLAQAYHWRRGSEKNGREHPRGYWQLHAGY